MKKVYIGNSIETKSLCIKIKHKKFYYYDFNLFEDEALQSQKCQVVGNTYLNKYKESQPYKLICFGKGYSVLEKRRNHTDKIVGYIEINEGKYIRVLKKKRHWFSLVFLALIVIMVFSVFYSSSLEQLFKQHAYPSRMEMEQQFQF